MEISGKKAIVTGGVRGLGRAMVEELLTHGAHVTVFDLDSDGLGVLKEERAEVSCVTCDLSDYEQVLSATTHYHEQFGSTDILINNAGILYNEPLIRIGPSGIEKHSVSGWSKVFAADLNSVFYMTVCTVEKMMAARTKGVIVNISSVAASGNAGQSAYSAAKAAVNTLTAVWAKELGAMGIRVVAVAPGFTDTESTKEILTGSVLSDTVKRVPLRRLGTPKEIAKGVLSVIENDFFNGKVLQLDGGLVL